jgi:hypothetical protein
MTYLNEIKATGVVGDEVRVIDSGRIVRRGGMAELAADDSQRAARPQPRFASMSALNGQALSRRPEILPALTPLVVVLVAAVHRLHFDFAMLTAMELAMG